MSPLAIPGPNHGQRPLLHDLQYHLEDGVPVLDNPGQREDTE